MFAWLIGAETSFSKALVYNMLTFSMISLFGAVVYSALIGLPVAAVKLTEKK